MNLMIASISVQLRMGKAIVTNFSSVDKESVSSRRWVRRIMTARNAVGIVFVLCLILYFMSRRFFLLVANKSLGVTRDDSSYYMRMLTCRQVERVSRGSRKDLLSFWCLKISNIASSSSSSSRIKTARN
jgi:hypothetical protein